MAPIFVKRSKKSDGRNEGKAIDVTNHVGHPMNLGTSELALVTIPRPPIGRGVERLFF